ncbi:hypothetical protein [Streptomyces sp. NPDC048636]|uniref:hypothetical protein n=1 Tax=Streptomyces sp. NPDC048636 TaxID=3155762 RepID=UPI00342B5FB2
MPLWGSGAPGGHLLKLLRLLKGQSAVGGQTVPAPPGAGIRILRRAELVHVRVYRWMCWS